MKCIICNKKTNWDESFGAKDYIVCPTCYWKIVKKIEKKYDLNKEESSIIALQKIHKKNLQDL